LRTLARAAFGRLPENSTKPPTEKANYPAEHALAVISSEINNHLFLRENALGHQLCPVPNPMRKVDGKYLDGGAADGGLAY
jgi:hypothetical protein